MFIVVFRVFLTGCWLVLVLSIVILTAFSCCWLVFLSTATVAKKPSKTPPAAGGISSAGGAQSCGRCPAGGHSPGGVASWRPRLG